MGERERNLHKDVHLPELREREREREREYVTVRRLNLNVKLLRRKI